MKTKNVGLFAVLTAFALALFASCADTGTGGSATLALDTRAIAAKSLAREAVSLADATEDSSKTDTTADKNGYTDTRRYKVVVPYTYDGKTYQATSFFDAEIYVSYATYESEVRNADAFSLTIDNLPLGKDVTFEMKVYKYYEHEKESYQDVVEETPFLVSAEPVTTTITDDTSVVITLKEYYEEPGDVTANTTFTLTATFPDDAEPVPEPVIVTLLADKDENPLDIQTNITTATFSADNPFVTDIKTNADASNIRYVEVLVFTSDAFEPINKAISTGAYYDQGALETLLDSLAEYLLYSGEAKTFSVTEGVTVVLESADEEDSGIDSDKKDEDKDTVIAEPTQTVTPLFDVPTDVTNFDASTDREFSARLTTITNSASADGSSQYAGKIVKITLNNDITYSATNEYTYNAGTSTTGTSALIIDLNGHTLTIDGSISAADYVGSVFKLETTTYVTNGTIVDARDDQLVDSNIFYNKSTLYLQDVTIQGGTHKAVYQGTDEAAAVLYVQGGTFTGFKGQGSAAIAPVWLDKGYAVFSGTMFTDNSTAAEAIYNKGELILTGNTTVSDKIDNDAGTTVLVGATIQGLVSNSGTLALLDSYTHADTKDDFSIGNNTNVVDGTATTSGTAINNKENATLILGKNIQISGYVYTYVDSNAVSGDKLTITTPLYVATEDVFTHEITIRPSAYSTIRMQDSTTTTVADTVAFVFGNPAEYNASQNKLVEVYPVTEALVKKITISDITSSSTTISGEWADYSNKYNFSYDGLFVIQKKD